MNARLRFAFVSGFVLVAVLLSGAFPLVALAQDESPPAPPESSESSPTEPPPPVATEPAPVDPITVASELPPGTDLVVLDSNGEELALGSAEAADVLATGDPMWCPDGVGPGGAGCTGGFTEFNDGTPASLLPFLQANAGTYFGAGTIYVQDIYSSLGEVGPIVIDGTVLTALTDLTIQGGWNGLFGGSYAIVGISTINVPLSVTNWGYDVTLNDLLVDTAAGVGINVSTLGDIELDHVESANNTGDGATLTNALGPSTVGITINNSYFHDNFGSGLTAMSPGDISFTDVYASWNSINGAYLSNGGGTSITNGDFQSNQTGYGLQVISGENISLTDVDASFNWNNGAYLSNGGSTSITDSYFSFNQNAEGLQVISGDDISLMDVDASFNSTYGAFFASGGSVSITNAYFNVNDTDYGLQISSAEDITLSNVDASFNWTYGAYLSNGGSTSITDSYFSFNYNDYGLQASNADDISLANVDASFNSTYGASLSNGGGTSISNSYFDFNENNYGLQVFSAEDISLANVDASFNSTFGAYFSNGGSTFVSDSYFSFNENDYGLQASSAGNISLANVDASYNSTYGAYLSNGGSTSITGAYFDANENDYGLQVFSAGNISLTSVDASYNSTYGAYLSNGGSLGINAGSFNNNENDSGLIVSTAGNVSLAQVMANENDLDGMNIGSNGNVSLTSVVASDNQHEGAYIDNVAGGGSVAVLWGTFDGNTAGGAGGEAGLDIHTNGTVSLQSVSASNNTNGDGADVNGSTPSGAFGSLFVSQSVFNNNQSVVPGWGVGLYASGDGNITVLNSQASDNGFMGMILITDGSVFIDPSTFNNNGGDGVLFSAGGDVTIQCGTFQGNDAYGIFGSAGGTTTLHANQFGGNTLGDYNIGPGAVVVENDFDCKPAKEKYPKPPAPAAAGGPTWNIVNVSGTQSEVLDCAAYLGTVLVLSNGDQAALPCPIGGDASLTRTAETALPGALGDGMTYGSAMELGVTEGGDTVDPLGGTARLAFEIPTGKDASGLTILFWNGSAWEDLGGSVNADGLFEVGSSHTGVFALASQ